MLEKLPAALGQALSEVRAGLDRTLLHAVDLRQGMGAMSVGSLAFADHAPMPARFTADGDGLSPPLHWSGVPAQASELVLIVEDADAPTPQPLVHAIAHGLAAGDGRLGEGALNEPAEVATGRNSFLGTRWVPPDPPPGHGTHRYVFQLFALGPGPALPQTQTPGRQSLVDALALRGLASGWLIGTYERPSGDIPTPLHSGSAARAG